MNRTLSRFRKAFFSSGTILALLLLTTVVRAQGTPAVILRLLAGVNIPAFAAQYQSTVLDQVPGTQVCSLSVPAGETAHQFADVLSADPRVVYAEEDVPLESPETNALRVPGRQMHLAFDGGLNALGTYLHQESFTQVNLGEPLLYGKGRPVLVAILDTGGTPTHPALLGRYTSGYNALNPALPPLDLPEGPDSFGTGHGTMVAGIIAHIAPNARLLPVKVLSAEGLGTLISAAKGIYYAVGQGARVINMSFGTHTRSAAMTDALDMASAAGVLLIASAGNDNTDQVQYPAAGHGAVAVAALEPDNTRWPYSNFGSVVRVCAPGSEVWSTYWNGGYASWSGTSFSAPFVAGQAALILGRFPSLTGEDVKTLIRNTARSVDNVNPNYRNELGKGIIDIERSVRQSKPIGR